MRLRTKQALADALKELMQTKSLDKITVKDLITKCNVNRKTFYYYFTDVYDLLRWILESDAENLVRQFDLITDLEDGLVATMNYIEANNHILKSAFNAVGRDMIKTFLQDYIMELCLIYVDRFAKQADAKVTEDYKRFVCDFYCNAISDTIIEWIQHIKHMDKQEVASYMSSVLLSPITVVLQNDPTIEARR